MIQYTIRQAKRFAVLLPGLLIAYFSVEDIYPYFNRRVPAAAAIFTTYVIGAYVLVPAMTRLYRIFRPASHVPLYCVTPDGFASDPLNIAIIGTRRQLITAMESIGWHMADRHSVHNMAQVALSAVLEQPYPNAPVSSLYLFGRKQDVAFEKHIEGGGMFSRHHVRFWATTYEQDETGSVGIHGIHWLHRHQQLRTENLLWVGAASLDVGLTFIRHNLQLTHMIHPDTDKERDLIIAELKAAKLIGRTKTTKLGDAYRVTNRVWRGFLHTDGRMLIARIK